jgi:hypothetical protein
LQVFDIEEYIYSLFKEWWIKFHHFSYIFINLYAIITIVGVMYNGE